MIESEQELRELVGFPSEMVNRKVISKIDEHCRRFISLSPFVTIATSDQNGLCDVSPRGDGPGFVYVIDEQHLVIPERPGNKRMDSLVNILKNPHIGLLFFIPGLGETLRINGEATLIQDEELLKKMEVKGKRPLLGIGVTVKECYIHCAKAILRSNLWIPESWYKKEQLPSAAQILKEHVKLTEYKTEEIEAMLQEGYKKNLY